MRYTVKQVLAGLVAAVIISSSWYILKKEPLPADIAVPAPSASATGKMVFPSDRGWSGGPPYVEVSSASFNDLPPEARCSKYFYSSEKQLVRFSCGWYEQASSGRVRRAFVDLSVPAGDNVRNWEFDQQQLILQPVRSTLHYELRILGRLAITVLTLFFAGVYIYAVQEDREEALDT